MKVGNVVARKDGKQLRSGSEAYGGGILVSLDPFILVSEGLDMQWNTLNKEDFTVYKNMTLTDEQLQPFLKRAKLID